jgi:hypothetical protein
MERFDVDMCLRELEERDEREKEALRKFLEHERRYKIDWAFLVGWIAILTFLGLFYGFTVAWLYPFIHRLLAKAGWL